MSSAALMLIIRNLGRLLWSKWAIMFALKRYTKMTNNKIDDTVLLIVQAGMNNDEKKLLEALKLGAALLEKRFAKK